MKTIRSKPISLSVERKVDTSSTPIPTVSSFMPTLNSARVIEPTNRENSIRFPKVQTYLNNLVKLINEYEIRNMSKNEETQLFNSISTVTEHIFSLYNIKINIINTEEYDSALLITPATSMKQATRCLYSIAELVTNLPFTFIQAIGFNKFTLCDKISLLNNNYKSVYETRVNSNAIFPINDLKTYEQVERHFYRILLDKIQKRDASTGFEWPMEFGTNVRRTRAVSMSEDRKKIASLTDREPNKVVDPEKLLRERQRLQTDALRKLFVDDDTKVTKEKAVDLANHTKFLKERMEAIDSVGFNNNRWWDEIGKLPAMNSHTLFLAGILID